MSNIHPSAIISEGARIDPSVTIGPYCVVGAEVVIGENAELKSHVVVEGRTSIGAGTVIYPFASIGHAPQDLKYHGEKSTLEIGRKCHIREYVTIQPGTEGGGMKTVVGDNCLFMVGSHVAHDCKLGNNVILANNATLAGHVSVGDNVIIGGLSAVHQFVRIGSHAIIGGMSGIEGDVIPYGSATAERAKLAGLNLVGLKRRGFSRESIHKLRNAFKMLFEDGSKNNLAERVKQVAEEFSDSPEVMQIVDFLRVDADRAICQPRAR